MGEPIRAPRRFVNSQAVEIAKAFLPVLLALTLTTLRANSEPGALQLWDFDWGVTNPWGGQYNVYARDPSWARTYLDPNVHRNSSGHSLRVTVHRESDGYAGVWLEFHPTSSGKRQYIDGSPYRFLSFWIKGKKVGENLGIQLVDANGLAHEDSNATQPLRAHLSKGVTTGWQEVSIPLSDFRGLDLRRLAQLNLKFSTPGDYRFYIADLSLTAKKTSATVTSIESPANRPMPPREKAGRVVWVWNSQDLLHRIGAAKRFFEFCAENHIGEVYLSLDFIRQPAPTDPQFDLRDREKYHAFLEQAHQQGLAVEGLAGTPEWAVRENHPYALAAVDTVLDFNRSGSPTARFDGVHFDVEPYSLVGFISSEYRSELLTDFLELISKSAERVRTVNLPFSCDVPAWFYPTDPLEQQRLMVTFRGETKTVGEHLTDLLESVTIMNYHNRADGATGIISSGIPALAYAASKGKMIVVGLETSLESEATVWFVCGLPVETFVKRLAQSELRRDLLFEGFRMTTLSHETHVHIGLSEPSGLAGERRAAFEKALLSLSRQLGAASDPERFPAEPILEEARAAIQTAPEWKNFETFLLKDPETLRIVAGFRAVHRMSPQITFHGLGHEAFNEETHSALEWLGRYPSFSGLAFHYYESYRDLLEGQ